MEELDSLESLTEENEVRMQGNRGKKKNGASGMAVICTGFMTEYDEYL